MQIQTNREKKVMLEKGSHVIGIRVFKIAVLAHLRQTQSRIQYFDCTLLGLLNHGSAPRQPFYAILNSSLALD